MNTTTALLIFARTASEESKHKSFEASEAFFRYQNKKLLELAKTSGLDYFWVDESHQIGENFAQRYLNAIQFVFEKDYEQVISIGNDSPGLSLDQINQSVQLLKSRDMCFGPSQDGGFYLWGVKKAFFKKEEFQNFPWKTQNLLSVILTTLEQQSISVDYLQTLGDLDFREDAQHLLKNTKLSFTLKDILLQMINPKQNVLSLFQPHLKSKFTDVYYNKGSPKSCLIQTF
jgi:glycosyltransferase A (GT-A) superfamily protein (DUF2064 family)